MLKRLLFVVFFCLGGFLFYIPKWVLMGTKTSRQLDKISKDMNQYRAPTPAERRLEEEQVRLGNWRPRS